MCVRILVDRFCFFDLDKAEEDEIGEESEARDRDDSPDRGDGDEVSCHFPF